MWPTITLSLDMIAIPTAFDPLGLGGFPAGFRRLNYIRCLGRTNGISTDILLNEAVITLDTETEGSNDNRGTYVSWYNAAGQLRCVGSRNGLDGIFWAHTQGNDQFLVAGATSGRRLLVYNSTSNKISIDGVLHTGISASLTSQRTSSPLTFFNNVGYVSGGICVIAKIYRVEVEKNNKLAHVFIPVLNEATGVPCLFDTATKTVFAPSDPSSYTYG